MKCGVQTIIGLCLLTTAARATPFPLAEPGGGAVIVGQSLFLNRAIEQCVGAKLREVPEAQYIPRPGDRPLYVGDTIKARELLAEPIKTLDAEGYILSVTPEYAVIFARKPTTPTGDPRVWAEADFARRFMGVDQYFPGELGQVFPRQERILIPCGLHVENPAFKHRHWSGYAGAAGPGWRVRASGGGHRFAFHHNLHAIISPLRYPDHPEYFPELNGKREVPKGPAGWQPCTSHPDVRRITIAYVLAHFAENPNSKSCSLGVNDNAGYCLCSACLAESPPGVDPKGREAVAYRFYNYYNAVAEEVAKTHPDVRLGFLAYGALNPVERAPQKLHPLLMPYITQNQADAFDPAYRMRIDAQFESWSKIAAQFGIYEYLFGLGFIIPRLYPHELATGLKVAHRCGADGFYAEAYPNWGLDGPKLWVAEKLVWNPDQDVEALLDTWHRALFAEAATEMRAYFARLEQAWMEQQPSRPARGGYRMWNDKKTQLTEVFPPPVCDEAWALIEKAEKAASQAIVKQRIAFFKSAFGATRLASQRFHVADKLRSMLTDKVNRTVYDWMLALDELARLPTLDRYMRPLEAEAPFSFHAFSAAAAEKKPAASFGHWDSDAPILLPLATRILDDAMARSPTNPPLTKADLNREIGRLLDDQIARAQAEGVSCEAAAALLRPVLDQFALNAGRLAVTPVIDGHIEDAWGEPSFDGQFFAYQGDRAGEFAPFRTRVWIGHLDNKLYVAFHCFQDPGALKPALAERDAVPRNAQNRLQFPDGGFPYYRVDSVGVLLPPVPESPLVLVTAAGGVFDGINSAFGYTLDWNGAEAQTKRTDDGWSAEIVITLGGDAHHPAPHMPWRPTPLQGGVRGFNFIRVTGNGQRSTWTPAPPQRWSINPGSGGVVFFTD